MSDAGYVVSCAYSTKTKLVQEEGRALSEHAEFAVVRAKEHGATVYVVTHRRTGFRVPNLEFTELHAALFAAEQFDKIKGIGKVQCDPFDHFVIMNWRTPQRKAAIKIRDEMRVKFAACLYGQRGAQA